MHKTDAIKLLGGTPMKAAKALGYRAVQTIYMWPDELPNSISDRVVGAVARLKAERKTKTAPAQAVAAE